MQVRHINFYQQGYCLWLITKLPATNTLHMHHGPSAALGVDNAIKKKTRLGILFFFIYLVFYGGFVAIGVLNYELLAYEIAGGINLALVYGMGLIGFAVILGIIYNFLCSRYEDEMNEKEAEV